MEQKIRLNLIPTGPMPVCYASQYDKKREIGLVLFNGTRPLLLTDETLELDVRKSDSHIVSIDIPTPEGTNLAVFETTEQMCAVAGSNECELRIKKAGADIGSLNFIMEIERSPMENGLQSDSEIRNLARQIAEAATPVVEEIAPPIIRDFLDDEYYTAEETDEAIENATEGKADTTYVDTELAKKADKTNTYTKTQVDNALNNKMDKANPTGTGAFSLNRKANTSIGTNSFAEGENATASGYGSHSEGNGTTASGNYSHAENNGTTASGNNSHAEGVHTTASGSGSHAEGYNTIANHKGQHAFGEYNIADNSTASASSRGNYIEIVGNGTDANNKSNARTLDWEGNETLAGDLTFNGSTSLTAEISRLDDKIDDLPEPMIYKGTLGTGGTIETLPAADASREGYTYKVITAGTYAGKEAKIGDTFTCCKPEGAQDFTWDYFSRGDTDTDTWRSIKVNGTEVIGSGISSGPVDFIGSENIEIEYESTGNKIKAKTKNLYTKAEVDDLIEDAVYDILPSDTESGPIANFETDLALPLKSMEIEVKAQQEAGTPTPASPLPINGRSAVNLTNCGGNFFDVSTITVASPYIDISALRLGSTYTICAKNTTNLRFFKIATTAYATAVWNGNAAGASFTVTQEMINIGKMWVINMSYEGASVSEIQDAEISLNYGNDSTYHEYTTPITTLINLDGTYYGGRLLQDKDGHRRLVVTSKRVDLGTLSWSTYSNVFYAILSDRKFAKTDFTDKTICEAYEYWRSSQAITNMPNYHYRFRSDTDKRIYFRNDSVSTASAFKTSVSGTYMTYELDEPIEIDLPDGEPLSALIGTNNIYADSGDTAVEFKESINQKIASLQALILNT